MSKLEKSFESMQQTIVEINQQLIEACDHMKKMMTHFNEPVSTTSPDQVQEHITFHKMNKLQTVRPKEQIVDLSNMSTHSIEMPSSPTYFILINLKSLNMRSRLRKLYMCMKLVTWMMIPCV